MRKYRSKSSKKMRMINRKIVIFNLKIKIMKILTAFICILFTIQLYSQKNKGNCSTVKRHSNAILKSNSLTIAEIAETERYDVHYYFLNLNMTNANTTISGTAEIRATARENLDSALIELFQSLNISSLKVDGISTPYSRVSNVIKIPVNKLQNESFKISIDYAGTPPNSTTNPLGGNGMTNDNSNSWGNVVTWSLSEPFGAYEWFPCKQSLKDKADSCDVWVTVPTNCKAGSNGVLQQIVDLGNGTHRFEWKHRHPIDYYLISVAVANYVEYNLYANPSNSAPVLIQNFIYDNPSTLPNFQSDIDETADFLELYADLYGPYPFADEKYGHCMVPISGGMEHQTMTSQGFFDNTLTSHELAHQWFGDHVTCNSWSHIWVNEGFASYSEDLMLEHLYPQDREQYMLDRHSRIMAQPNGSVWVEDSLNENSIFNSRLVYDKGAAIIHTLRFLINDDTTFFNALKNIQIQYADSTASAMDFIHVFENESGLDLTNYAQEWYYGEGYPIYGVRYNKVGNDLLVEINQVSSASGITPTFTNDLELNFSRSVGGDTIIRFPINGTQNQFVISNASNYIATTSIDPNNWIINKVSAITHDANFTSLNELTEFVDSRISLYPNPAKELLNIEMPQSGSYEYKLIDMQGKMLQNGTFNATLTLNLKSYQSGTFLIQVSNKLTGSKISKLISH